jgi:hypothetical protein
MIAMNDLSTPALASGIRDGMSKVYLDAAERAEAFGKTPL